MHIALLLIPFFNGPAADLSEIRQVCMVSDISHIFNIMLRSHLMPNKHGAVHCTVEFIRHKLKSLGMKTTPISASSNKNTKIIPQITQH